MGSLIRVAFVWLWCLCGTSYAKQQVLAVLSAGPAIPGASVQVDIATLEDGEGQGGVPPEISINGDAHKGAVRSLGVGRWRLEVVVGTEPSQLDVSYGDASTTLTIRPTAFGDSALIAPKRVDGRTRRSVNFEVKRRDGSRLDVDTLSVSANEGESTLSRNEDGSVAVEWSPGPKRFPRVVSLVLQDDSRPTDPPFVTAVHLSAQPTIPITTEAGAKVTLRQGTQVLGPIIADADGMAVFKVDVVPGVHAVEVELEDQLGNRQTKAISIGSPRGPWVTMVQMGSMIAGGAPPNVYIVGMDEIGRPWTRSNPDCGEGVSPVVVAPGLWRYQPSQEAIALGIDHRIDCSIGGGPVGTLTVPVNRSRATRLVLQSYPDQLAADIPIAELQAYLLNGLGERLPSSGIQLESEIGVIQRDRVEAPTLVRARYDGTLAAPRQEDLIRATWNHPSGFGGLWDLAVRGAAPGDASELLVDVRAVDQGGRPLANETVEVTIRKKKTTLKTDVRGWATVTTAWPKGADSVVVTARNRRIVRRTIVLRGDRAEATQGRPDLVTEVLLPILPGRVHGVHLSTHPRTLTNDGMTGRIEVRLEDKLGNPVTGQPVQLTASYGVIGPVTLLPNGSFVASFAPPIGMSPGTTRITATTEDGLFSASTDVEIVHRVVNLSVGAQGGYIVGGNKLASPWIESDIDALLPFGSVYVRGSVGLYSPSASDRDGVTGGEVELDMAVVPIGLGVLARKSPARVPTWVGGQVVMAPYKLVARVSDVTASEGVGWMSPGATVFGGIGIRLGAGELYGQAKYLFLSAPETTIGWEGSVGGVVGALGYKLLY